MASDILDFIQADNELYTQEVRNLKDLTLQLARQAVGQGDDSVPIQRLYADFALSASAKIVTIVPRESSQVSLWGDNGWDAFVLPPSITLDFTTGTSGKKHDIFLYVDASATATIPDTVKISAEFVAWTNETTRATALDTVDGIYLKNGDNSRRWIGTAYYDGTNVFVTGGSDPLLGIFYGKGDPNDIPGTSPTGSGMQNPGIIVNNVRWDIFSFFGGALRFGVSAINSLLAIGSNISAAATTALAVFGAAQTYNSESMDAGAILMGDNSAGKGNILYTPSTGRITIRNGTTAVVSINPGNSAYIAGAVNTIMYQNFK